MRRPAFTVLVALGAVTVALTGCGSSASGAGARPAAAGGVTGSALSGDLTVYAAASLTGSFKTLAARFEAAHPGAKITLSFAASSTLATQIIQGAPADVFASASKKNMDQVVAAGEARAPVTFVRNVMEIAVPPDNPAHVTGVADLARPGVKVAVCAQTVPCGSVARQVFAKAEITVTPVTNEADVKSTLTKVELGEVDAGVVYVTDVRAAGAKVTGITIPAAVNASTSYPIAALSGTKHSALAAAFVSYVLSADGAAVLTAAGFAKP